MAGHQGKSVHVRGLALIGSHAECRVALEVLDCFIAFLMGDLHISGRHVVLEIDEGLDCGGVVSVASGDCGLRHDHHA